MTVEWHLIRTVPGRETNVEAALDQPRRAFVVKDYMGTTLFPGYVIAQIENSPTIRNAILSVPDVIAVCGPIAQDEVDRLLDASNEKPLAESQGFRVGDCVCLKEGTPTKWAGRVTAVTTSGLEVDFEMFGQVIPGTVAPELVDNGSDGSLSN